MKREGEGEIGMGAIQRMDQGYTHDLESVCNKKLQGHGGGKSNTNPGCNSDHVHHEHVYCVESRGRDYGIMCIVSMFITRAANTIMFIVTMSVGVVIGG